MVRSKTEMKVADVMSRSAVAIGQNVKIPEIVRLLAKYQHSSVAVVDNQGRIIGIVSEADLLRVHGKETQGEPSNVQAVSRYGTPTPRDQIASDVMQRNVITVTEDTSLRTLLEHFELHRLRQIPVTRDKMVVGSVARQDLLRVFVAHNKDLADNSPAKNVQEDQFMDLFSANQTGIGAGPYSFGPSSLPFRFFAW